METETYMQEAIRLAKLGEGKTSPNPMVGAVIVKEGKVVGRGWHKKAGTPHAEIHAIHEAGEAAKDATMYVSLEPCCFQGRTGPCSEAIQNAGIRKVVVAMTDPNPKVSGKGIECLRAAGIEVEEGIMARAAAQLNEAFIKWIHSGMPFGVMKVAMSIDGKIATKTGHSRWITGEKARHKVHELRNQYDGILVGIGTVLTDDPLLTTRLPNGGRNPVRIIVDSTGRIPLSSQVVTDKSARTILATTNRISAEKHRALEDAGVELLYTEPCHGQVDIYELYRQLGKRNIVSVMVEGGSKIHAAMLDANVIDKCYFFIAPKIIGGQDSPGPVAELGILTMEDALLLEEIHCEILDHDCLISGYLRGREGRNVYRACGRIG